MRWARRVNPQRLVFVDEAGANITMGWSQAWVRRGQELVEPRPTNWGPNLTMIGAIFKTRGARSATSGGRLWLQALDVETLFIEPGSPWENGYVESFTGKLRDEFLDREVFYTLTEAKVLIERWRRQYNTVRPHSALGYRPPAPEAISPAPLSGLIMSPALS